MLEVAEAPVHQSRRPARRAAREIILFDKRNLDATQRCVTRDAAASNAAADDEQIVLVTRERLELSVPQLSWRDILRGAASRQIVLREIVALDRAPGLSGSLSESSHS